MSVKEKILITGASGFIGKSLLSKIDLNRYEIAILTRTPSKFESQHGYEIKEGDLNDLQSLKTALEGSSVLINLAAEVRNTAKLAETNIGGTENLLKAISETPTIKKVIHLSSVGVVGAGYSLSPLKVNEEFSPSPKNEYERTKLESERLFVDYFKNSGLSWSVLRPTNVFGPNHPFDALLNLMKHLKVGKRFVTTATAQVNYVYVDDLSFFILNRLENNELNAIFNVGESMPLVDFQKVLAQAVHVPVKMTCIPKFIVKLCVLLKFRKLDSVSNEVIYSDAKLKSVFSYPVGIVNGIKETVLYYKQQNKLQ